MQVARSVGSGLNSQVFLMAACQLPAPPIEHIDEENIAKRVWIGNLDTKITEFALLKLLQKYGELEKFDFLYNITEPDKGKPRGYCFATYCTVEGAVKVQKALNGKRALRKRMVVKPAKLEKPNAVTKRTTAEPSSSRVEPTNGDTKSQISAIEQQLKKLERKKDSDVEAFLPAERKRFAINPLAHCLEKTDCGGTKTLSKAKNSNTSRTQSSHHKWKS